MNTERDKFLTEYMGLVYHDFHWSNYGSWYCNTCKIERDESDIESLFHKNYDFSTWEGFGKLWDKIYLSLEYTGHKSKTSFWNYCCFKLYPDYFERDMLNHPDKFANALYSFLKEN